MTQRDIFKKLTLVHRWFGLLLGFQILIWFSSGFVMSFFDIEKVRGRHIAEKVEFDLKTEGVVPIGDLPDGALKRVELISAVGSPVYKVHSDKVQYVDAATAEIWTGLDKTMAAKAADAYYMGDISPEKITLLDTAPIEYRGPTPVWQICYKDPQKTRLYIDYNSGELKAVRTRLWRIFDFMWMLHIMDYDGRDDINNWWLWLCAAAAFLFALTGIALVFHRMVLRPSRRRNKGHG